MLFFCKLSLLLWLLIRALVLLSSKQRSLWWLLSRLCAMLGFQRTSESGALADGHAAGIASHIAQTHDGWTYQRMWLFSFILWLACPQDGHARERLRPPTSPQNAFRACACALHHHDTLLTCLKMCNLGLIQWVGAIIKLACILQGHDEPLLSFR